MDISWCTTTGMDCTGIGAELDGSAREFTEWSESKVSEIEGYKKLNFRNRN